MNAITIELVGSYTAVHVDGEASIDLTSKRNRSTTKSPIPVLCRELVQKGYDPDTRVHVVRKALNWDGTIQVFKRDRKLCVWAELDCVESEKRSLNINRFRKRPPFFRNPTDG